MALPRNFHDNIEIYKKAYGWLNPDRDIWLITWNPKPCFYQYNPNRESNYDLQWKTMLDLILPRVRCLSNYALVPEISDAGKLHLHGFYQIKDKVKYHKSFLPSLKKNGFIKVNKVSKHQWKTYQYHIKDLEVTNDFITQVWPLVVTDETSNELNRDLQLWKLSVNKQHYEEVKNKSIKKLNVYSMLLGNFIEDELE